MSFSDTKKKFADGADFLRQLINSPEYLKLLPKPIFQEKRGRINWRNIPTIQLQNLTQENYQSIMDGMLSGIVFAQLDRTDHENFGNNKHIITMFQLSQLAIQYLSQIQHHFALEEPALAARFQANSEKLKTLEDQANHQKSTIENLKEYIHKCKDAIAKKKHDLQTKHLFKCELCTNKYFASEKYLKAHQERRHKEFEQKQEKTIVNKLEKVEKLIEQKVEMLTAPAVQQPVIPPNVIDELQRNYKQQLRTSADELENRFLDEIRALRKTNDVLRERLQDVETRGQSPLEKVFTERIEELMAKVKELELKGIQQARLGGGQASRLPVRVQGRSPNNLDLLTNYQEASPSNIFGDGMRETPSNLMRSTQRLLVTEENAPTSNEELAHMKGTEQMLFRMEEAPADEESIEENIKIDRKAFNSNAMKKTTSLRYEQPSNSPFKSTKEVLLLEKNDPLQEDLELFKPEQKEESMSMETMEHDMKSLNLRLSAKKDKNAH